MRSSIGICNKFHLVLGLVFRSPLPNEPMAPVYLHAGHSAHRRVSFVCPVFILLWFFPILWNFFWHVMIPVFRIINSVISSETLEYSSMTQSMVGDEVGRDSFRVLWPDLASPASISVLFHVSGSNTWGIRLPWYILNVFR